jgi:hypothetical protein
MKPSKMASQDEFPIGNYFGVQVSLREQSMISKMFSTLQGLCQVQKIREEKNKFNQIHAIGHGSYASEFGPKLHEQVLHIYIYTHMFFL